AHAGDDVITVDGSGTKTIDGGAGTDGLVINYTGINSLGSFTSTIDGDYTVLTDGLGNSVSYKNIEALTVGSYAYTNDTAAKSFYSSAEGAVYLYQGGNLSNSSAPITDLQGSSNDLQIIGSGAADTVSINIARTGPLNAATGNFVISLGEGDDTLNGAVLENNDIVNLGAGNDLIEVIVDAYDAPQSLSNINVNTLDGGDGIDTLSFASSGFTSHSAGAALALDTGGATNFENVIGTYFADTISGDDKSNYLYGYSGSTDADDIIYGQGGNDFLLANNNTDGGTDRDWLTTPSNGENLSEKLNFLTKFDATGDVQLFGGTGDDVLIGAKGEDILDGGTGRDHLAGGDGVDTFVLRAGDGSTDIAQADLIYDFTDGVDVLGLDNGLQFAALEFFEVDGNSAIRIIETGEYLAIIQSASFSFDTGGSDYSFSFDNLGVEDFASTDTNGLTITGTSSDEILIGGAGGDTITTDVGSDAVYAHAGDDVITVDGSGTKTIDGGAGTDGLVINYTG
ncbi:MAG: hypothetical protein EBT20_19500, partial [Alphaproteobacteria bacterium]|nr:hypothetical protein [Alphaproteobacteria bacterium]